MVDYSKWDSIELSDDSDTATHPIHSKSALKQTKQKRVHYLRRERSSRINNLRCEEATNNSTRLCEQDTPPGPSTAGSPTIASSETLKSIVIRTAQASAAKMVEKPEFSLAILEAVELHCKGIVLRQEAIAKQLKRCESTKITSECYRVTIDGSSISKFAASSAPPARSVETERGPPDHGSRSSFRTLNLVSQFAQVDSANYQASEAFIVLHREIMQDQAIHELLRRAHDASGAGQDALAYRRVCRAMVLQWCRSLGGDGVAIFFRRIATRHQARESFLKEVADKFRRMRAAPAKW
ncbi:hypothetical protein V2A60_001030 [Cordyceps javanica]